MEARQINEALNIQFVHYDYRLNNSHIFGYDWESDFICKSSSGYWVEVEVKISRSDFLRDFKKPKHKLFSALHAGRTHIVEETNFGEKEGDLLASWIEPVFHTDHGPFSGARRQEYQWLHVHKRGARGWDYVVNDWGRIWVHHERKELFAPSTRIRFRELLKENIPHQFYFAVPAGLVKLAEIPIYAGLLYVDEDGITVARRAPYLHKRPMDLTHQLLRKYYNLWRFTAEVDKYESCKHLNIYNL